MSSQGYRRLAERLADLSRIPSRVAGDAADEISTLIQGEFASGNDPYGQPWATLADATIARGRSAPPLTDTGALAEGLEVTPMQGAGIEISFSEAYGAFHQTGTVNMPPRPILPTDQMPEAWSQAIAGSFARSMGEAMK